MPLKSKTQAWASSNISVFGEDNYSDKWPFNLNESITLIPKFFGRGNVRVSHDLVVAAEDDIVATEKPNCVVFEMTDSSFLTGGSSAYDIKQFEVGRRASIDLNVGDLHLSDDAKEEYRWEIFDVIYDKLEKFLEENFYSTPINAHKSVDIRVRFLGDVTDSKDKHSNRFIRNVLDSFVGLQHRLSELPYCDSARIFILRGNHDEQEDGTSFLGQLNEHVRIYYVDCPVNFDSSTGSRTELYLPWSPAFQWHYLKMFDGSFPNLKYLYLHNTVAGSVVSNGTVMDGVNHEFFKGLNPDAIILAGDVHVPQICGRVEYIGAPYQIKFGDNYTGRFIMVVNGKRFPDIDLKYDFPRKLTLNIKDPSELDFSDVNSRDRVRVRIHLDNSDAHMWNSYRDQVKSACLLHSINLDKLELVLNKRKHLTKTPLLDTAEGVTAITPKNTQRVFEEYCNRESIFGELKQVGNSILNAGEE